MIFLHWGLKIRLCFWIVSKFFKTWLQNKNGSLSSRYWVGKMKTKKKKKEHNMNYVLFV